MPPTGLRVDSAGGNSDSRAAGRQSPRENAPLQFIIGMVAGLVAAWWLRKSGWQWRDKLPELKSAALRAWALFTRWEWPGRSATPQQTPATLAAPVVDEPAPSHSHEEEVLNTRLRALEAGLDSSLAQLGHPRELADMADFRQAVALLENPRVARETVLLYACDSHIGLACAALAALAKRADGEEVADRVARQFPDLAHPAMHFALKYLAGLQRRLPVGAPLVGARAWWSGERFVLEVFRDHFAERQALGDDPLADWRQRAATASDTELGAMADLLERIDHPFARALLPDVQDLRVRHRDRTFLSTVGRFWADRKEPEILIEPDDWKEALAAAEAQTLGEPARSLMLSGDTRVGKTTFLRLLARRLEGRGWTVFEAGAADLMAGQLWFGQLEGRIQQVVAEAGVSKRYIWYIPDILQIALSGTHQGQAASILDQILPAVSAGRLLVWTEASAASLSRLLRLRPVLRGTLEVVRLEPQDQEGTLQLAETLAARLGESQHVEIESNSAGAALHCARQYLSSASLPGSVLDLIKLTVGRAVRNGERRVDAHSVILTLSQLTGLPVSILDNKERVDLASIREYFTSRVMGQDEAVGAVVDRIAMLKAGLNDPGKPVGVFLFAGPTGTGKTELAKTLSEYLFGSVDRLIRLDMSEFQTSDAIVKILGGGAEGHAETDSLINRVRKQPFSVVLLDEFEKAHANIWDLFLQVFDDGRLTDTLGHVADFRHCIIILTTNLGATSHRSSGLGFAPANEGFTGDQIMQAVSQTFRPEFQNRLDKVIVFRPLTRDLMRGILRKELGRVLERRGLKDRDWAVEWEASAQEFLLEKGFSPEMGARPLKRAIDQYVMAPLAATIVEQRFPEGDQFVFMRSDGRAIQAEFVDPDSDARSGGVSPPAGAGALPSGNSPTLPAIILAPAGTSSELKVVEAEYGGITHTLESLAWEEQKARFSTQMLAADFWSRPDRHETLSRLALIDRVQAAARTAASLRGRLASHSERGGKSSRELVARLALQLHLVKEGIKDVTETAPIEVALAVEPAFEKTGPHQATLKWCAQLLAMYRAWSTNRHMQVADIPGSAAQALPLLLISGFGAHRLLSQEVGLHVLELAEGNGSSGRVIGRVRLAIAPLGDLGADKLRVALMAALEQGLAPHAVVRRYRDDPSPLVRDMNASWRTGRLDAVLRGDFDLIAASQAG